MPLLLRRKSRVVEPSPPPPDPPPPSLDALAPTGDFTASLPTTYSPLRSSSDLAESNGRSPSRAKVHAPPSHSAAFHTPYAYSPPNQPQQAGWGALPRSASDPSCAWTPSPPTASPPGLLHPSPYAPPGPANINFRRSTASFLTGTTSPPPNPSPSVPLPPLPSGHPSSPPRKASLPKSPSLPASLSVPVASPLPSALSRQSTRRPRRPPPSYTLLVAGGKRTGKTSFVRLLSEVLTPAADGRVERGVDDGAGDGVRRTTLEVVEQGEKLLLSLLDAPGLSLPLHGPLSAADDLSAETYASSLLRLLETRFEATLRAETELVRSPGAAVDPHVHVCLWFVHPEGLVGRGDAQRMSEAEVRCILRLSERVVVVPILARTDTLTLPALHRAKAALARSLSPPPAPADLLTSLFSLSGASPAPASPVRTSGRARAASSVRSSAGEAEADAGDGSAGADSHLAPVPVVHLTRSRSHSASQTRRPKLAHSQTGGTSVEAVEEGAAEADISGGEAEREKEGEARRRWPLGVVMPDYDEDEGSERGKRWVREYRHGTVDVLNPSHNDFPLLRSLLFGERVERLKSHARLAFYEPFRTARLLSLHRAPAPPPTSLLPSPYGSSRPSRSSAVPLPTGAKMSAVPFVPAPATATKPKANEPKPLAHAHPYPATPPTSPPQPQTAQLPLPANGASGRVRVT
ncbi:hypothetical protein JCM10207_005049 [Rhodosporidiobolus poonsookiae]